MRGAHLVMAFSALGYVTTEALLFLMFIFFAAGMEYQRGKQEPTPTDGGSS